MKALASKVLSLIFLIVVLTCSYLYADVDELIHYDLSLAGYKLGMTLDEAYSVRPVLYVQDTGSDKPDVAEDYFDAYADHVFVDGIEMNLWIRFKNERLYKIIARFAPDETGRLAGIFNQALGAGEDKSRSYPDRDGNNISQTVFFWDYPTAKMYLVKSSSNSDYATIGLTAKPAYAETFSGQD